mmetsp:Transcript_13387/g.25129  ORF Transcript_13387/g.25129 Transcript_13387/m.25129 type:complete len:221 (+) Transcript_13387:1348-2010(+)
MHSNHHRYCVRAYLYIYFFRSWFDLIFNIMTKSIVKKSPPVAKKVINVKIRVTSVYSSVSAKAPTNLCGIECQNGIYIAWLEKAGPSKEAAYILPFTTAFHRTVNDEGAVDLYPGDSVSGNMLELWKIDYMLNRREPMREQSNIILFSKGFPFKCFVWIRPDDGPDAEVTLDSWLHNLSNQMMQFAKYTMKNDSLYGNFKWGLNLRIIIEKRYILPRKNY